MKILRPLHNLLLIVSALFFLAAFLTLKKTLDINLYDTTYIVPFSRIFMVGAVFLSLLWLLYTFTYHLLFSQKLYKVHIIGSAILFVIVIAGSLWSNQLIQRYTGSNPLEVVKLSTEIGNSIAIASLLLTSIQLLYPLNLIIGLLKNKKR
jgi:ABC-type transport system involved in cytochrome c biogenesis permease subunit